MTQIRGVLMAEKKEKEFEEVPRFSFGADLLDQVVGGGLGMGIPAGKIINLVGDKSSFKTFLACEILAAARYRYKKKVKWEYDDCESGFTFNTQAIYGFKIMPESVEDRRRSKTVEELYCNVRDFIEGLKEDELGIYIVDSLDGLTSDEMEKRADERYKKFKKDEEFKQGSYQMGKAKFLSQEFFPPIAELCETKTVLLVIISQIRENIEAFSFEKYVRAGGKALDFYCHTVLWLAQRHKIKKKGRVIGVLVKAKTTKSKTPRPYRDCEFSCYFDYGIDNVGTNLDFLFNLRGESGELLKISESVVWKGEEQTVASLKAFIEEFGKMEEYKQFNKEVKKSAMLEWIATSPEMKALHEDRFGVPMHRDELIQFIEDKGLQKELTERVIDKWETIEASIKVDRKPKYRD